MNPPDHGAATRASILGLAQGIDWCLEVCGDSRPDIGSAPSVSAWSVAEHLEHLMLADQNICGWIVRATAQTNPAERPETPNTIGARILEDGLIPRGRGPAPEMALPRGIARSEIAAGFGRLRGMADELATELVTIHACRATLPHHVLGHFTPSDWLRFLHVHHVHHAKIIEDILA